MFREEIIDEMEFRKGLPAGEGRLTAKQLANLVCPHKPSIFESRFSQLKKGKIYELHFHEFYAIAKILFPLDFAERLKSWCYDFRNYDNIMCSLEFATTHRMFDLQSDLINYIKQIDTNSDAANMLKNIAGIYEISRVYQQRTLPNKEIRKILREFSPKSQVSRALKFLLECNTYANEFDFRGFNLLIEDVRQSIKQIENKYIRFSYKIRLFELLSRFHLYAKNDIKKARKYSKLVINADIGSKFTADGYYILGMSFLYDDQNKCLTYINDYANMIAADGREDLAREIKDRDLAFVSTVWGVRSNTSDISEKAHYEARWGDKEVAKNLIDKAIEEKGETPYRIYYKALACEDIREFSKAFSMFIANDNIFHARLVVNSMSRWPEIQKLYQIQLENFKIK